MNCKKCGKEIVGQIKRYCDECKSNSTMSIRSANKEIEEKPEKRPRVFSFGYILLIIFIITVTFMASCFVGFAIGPVLPI